jgi:histidinol phosphatase-like PHP family hydrolase
MKKIDMHFHTILSDWIRDNNEVIKEAKEKWISFLSVTEHDIINNDLVLLARVNWINSVWGVEISAEDDKVTWRSLHLTCYSNKFWKEIRDILENTREKRKLKVRKQIEKLEENWFTIDYKKFIRFYKNLGVNIDNINNFHIEDYIFQNEDKLDKLLLSFIWKKLWWGEFIEKILKKSWEYRDIWWEQIPKYEPSVSKIWSIARENNYFLSLAHPNFTFRNNKNWFLEFIEEYQDKLNWIEINSQASKDWVDLIIDTTIKYNLILTFWSDSHYKWRDSKHWDLWDINKYISKDIVEENFEDFLYELSKYN